MTLGSGYARCVVAVLEPRCVPLLTSLALTVLVASIAVTPRARAQAFDAEATPPPASVICRACDDETALAARLAAERRAILEARANEGWTLVAFAAASIATGVAFAGAGAAARDDRTVWAGIGTAGWGAINALFSLFLFDLSGAAGRDIEADRSARGADLVAAREDAARDQYGTATLIAVNAGLDVFYVAAGLLLFALGDLADPGDGWTHDGRDALVGYGGAMAAQGGVLLVYDVVTWLLAQERGDRILRMGREPAHGHDGGGEASEDEASEVAP